MRNQCVILNLVIAVIFGASATTSAQVPGPEKQKAPVLLVKDEAMLFGKEAVEEVNAIVKKVKERHGKDLFIETVAKGPERDKAAQWASDRYSELKVDGVYMVIAKKPGYFRIFVGAKTLKTHFTMANITELEKICAAKDTPNNRIVRAATYVLETMSKAKPDKSKDLNK